MYIIYIQCLILYHKLLREIKIYFLSFSIKLCMIVSMYYYSGRINESQLVDIS